MTNLRARQRLQTAEELRRAAVDLVFEHGLDNVTTEMIADEAGVSPRTFFNYYPFKEAALIPPKEDFPETAIALFIAAPGSLEEDLITLIVPMTSCWDDDRPMIRKLFSMANSHPKLSALKASSVHEHEMDLRMLMAARLGQRETDFLPMLFASVITSAIRIAMETWANEESGPDETGGTSGDSVRRALTGIRTMFDPLKGGQN